MKPLIDDCTYAVAELILKDLNIKSRKEAERVWEMLYRRIHMILAFYRQKVAVTWLHPSEN